MYSLLTDSTLAAKLKKYDIHGLDDKDDLATKIIDYKNSKINLKTRILQHLLNPDTVIFPTIYDENGIQFNDFTIAYNKIKLEKRLQNVINNNKNNKYIITKGNIKELDSNVILFNSCWRQNHLSNYSTFTQAKYNDLKQYYDNKYGLCQKNYEIITYSNSIVWLSKVLNVLTSYNSLSLIITIKLLLMMSYIFLYEEITDNEKYFYGYIILLYIFCVAPLLIFSLYQIAHILSWTNKNMTVRYLYNISYHLSSVVSAVITEELFNISTISLYSSLYLTNNGSQHITNYDALILIEITFCVTNLLIIIIIWVFEDKLKVIHENILKLLVYKNLKPTKYEFLVSAYCNNNINANV